jgi:hypothetical protein
MASRVFRLQMVDPQQLVLDLAADPSQISDGWDNGQPIDLGLDFKGGSLPGGNSPNNPWGSWAG